MELARLLIARVPAVMVALPVIVEAFPTSAVFQVSVPVPDLLKVLTKPLPALMTPPLNTASPVAVNVKFLAAAESPSRMLPSRVTSPLRLFIIAGLLTPLPCRRVPTVPIENP